MYFKFNKESLYGLTPNELTEFHRDGELEEFDHNLKTQPIDWIYRNKKIFYKHNSYGHRSVEPSELGNEFFITAGCSMTYGQSLALEDTWPYRLSQKIKMPYYNLGLGAAGVDLTSLNLSLWFKNIKLKPKFIVILWPESHRMFFKDENNNLGPLGPWIIHRKEKMKKYYKTSIGKKSFEDYQKLLMTDIFDHYSEILKINIEETIKAMGIKVIIANEFLIFKDLARDLHHHGIDSHEYVSEKLFKCLK